MPICHACHETCSPDRINNFYMSVKVAQTPILCSGFFSDADGDSLSLCRDCFLKALIAMAQQVADGHLEEAGVMLSH